MENCEAILDENGVGKHCKKCNTFWYLGDDTRSQSCHDLSINKLRPHSMIDSVVMPRAASIEQLFTFSNKPVIKLKPFYYVSFFTKHSWKSPVLKWNDTRDLVYKKLLNQFKEDDFLFLSYEFWVPRTGEKGLTDFKVELYDFEHRRLINIENSHAEKLIRLLLKDEVNRKENGDFTGYAAIFKKPGDMTLTNLIRLLEV